MNDGNRDIVISMDGPQQTAAEMAGESTEQKIARLTAERDEANRRVDGLQRLLSRHDSAWHRVATALGVPCTAGVDYPEHVEGGHTGETLAAAVDWWKAEVERLKIDLTGLRALCARAFNELNRLLLAEWVSTHKGPGDFRPWTELERELIGAGGDARRPDKGGG